MSDASRAPENRVGREARTNMQRETTPSIRMVLLAQREAMQDRIGKLREEEPERRATYERAKYSLEYVPIGIAEAAARIAEIDELLAKLPEASNR